MKKIAISVNENQVSVDLGGDLDGSCCGREADILNKKLKKLGVDLNMRGILCRLPVAERVQAKLSGECNAKLKEAMLVAQSTGKKMCGMFCRHKENQTEGGLAE